MPWRTRELWKMFHDEVRNSMSGHFSTIWGKNTRWLTKLSYAINYIPLKSSNTDLLYLSPNAGFSLAAACLIYLNKHCVPFADQMPQCYRSFCSECFWDGKAMGLSVRVTRYPCSKNGAVCIKASKHHTFWCMSLSFWLITFMNVLVIFGRYHDSIMLNKLIAYFVFKILLTFIIQLEQGIQETNML